MCHLRLMLYQCQIFVGARGYPITGKQVCASSLSQHFHLVDFRLILTVIMVPSFDISAFHKKLHTSPKFKWRMISGDSSSLKTLVQLKTYKDSAHHQP